MKNANTQGMLRAFRHTGTEATLLEFLTFGDLAGRDFAQRARRGGPSSVISPVSSIQGRSSQGRGAGAHRGASWTPRTQASSRMLTGHPEAGQPMKVSCAESPCPAARASLEQMDANTEAPQEDGRAEETLRLQKQISQLRGELRRHASRWSSAHSALQSQIDTLTKQNLELRDELRVTGLQLLEAQKNPAPLPAAHKLDTLVLVPTFGKNLPLSAEEEITPEYCKPHSALLLQPRLPPKPPTSIKMERTDSEKTAEEDGDRAPSRSFQDRCPPATAGTVPLEERLSEDGQFLSVKPVPSRGAVCPTDSATGKEDTQEKQHLDGKVERTLSDGRRIITFPNGTRKEVSADKKSTVTRFFNGDVKKVKPDQRVIYYYADARTTHTTYPDGVEIVRFPNKQTEKFNPDGSKETVFPDGTVTRLKGGREETVFPDGTTVSVKRNGDKTIVFSNGQKEIHTAQFRRREFPDGTVKTVYSNGCQETKYASGRVKVKDETGNIILDQK